MPPGGGLIQLNAYGCFDTFLTEDHNNVRPSSCYHQRQYIINKNKILPKQRYVNFTVEINEKNIDRSKLTILDKIKLTTDILLNCLGITVNA